MSGRFGRNASSADGGGSGSTPANPTAPHCDPARFRSSLTEPRFAQSQICSPRGYPSISTDLCTRGTHYQRHIPTHTHTRTEEIPRHRKGG